MNIAVVDDPTPTLTPSGLVVQRLVAVPWRHAGLIGAFALAGAAASLALSPRVTPPPVAAVHHFQPIEDAPEGVDLRLDPEPGAAPGNVQIADAAPSPSAPLRLDADSPSDEIDAMLGQAPPAAGWPMPSTAARGDGRRPTLPGLAAGLLLGLLAASLRELGGQRMRSPREAQWALGAPVLGAIPTLSSKARDALVEPASAA